MDRRTLPFAARGSLVLAVLLGAAILLTWSSGAKGPAIPAEAAFPGVSGKIAFESDQDGDREIYVINADGSGQAQLTTDPAVDQEPAWSPDGSRIAFVSFRTPTDVYVMNADGTAETQLTTDTANDDSPSWCNTGKIAFQSNRDGDGDIYLMNDDGTVQTDLTQDATNEDNPACSPDGSTIAFTRNPSGPDCDIYVMSASDGSGETDLSNNTDCDDQPNRSPDGTKIAFVSNRDGNLEIYVMNADGSGQTNCTDNSAADTAPAWSPDGDHIAFQSNRDGDTEIYVMDAADCAAGSPPAPDQLTTNTAADESPDWQPQAVARVISGADDLIGGGLSRGRLGDYYLSNGKVQFVIQQPQRNLLSVGQFGGQIIDADLVRAPGDPERDHFEEFAFGINIENTAHYTSVSVLNDGSNGEPAVIRATGVDDLLDFINPSTQAAAFGITIPAQFNDVDLPVSITTDYILTPGDDYVEVRTTVQNTDAVNPVDTFFTEFFNGSSQSELFLPGYGFGAALVTSACPLCNFVGWSGFGDTAGVAYGYIHNVDAGDADTTDDTTTFNTDGVTIPILDESAALALIGGALPNYHLAPQGQAGDAVTVIRYFTIGRDIGDIVDTRNQLLGYTTGTLSGTVTRGGSPVEAVDIVVLGAPADGPGGDTSDPGDDIDKNVVAHYLTDANGQYQGTLPPGGYTVKAQLDGHMPATPDPGSVTITASGVTKQNFTIPEAGRLKVTIVDESNNPIAGRASVVGFDQNPDPGNSQDLFGGFIKNRTKLFGDTSRDPLPFGVAKMFFAGQTGDSGEVFIEPGNYQVVVSHGTEYSAVKQDITVTAGALTTVNAQIARVVDTAGFVAGDFHVHAAASPDGMTSNKNRVITALAEGLEFFSWTDHEFRTNAPQEITDLGVGSLVSAVPSNENTTPDYGHFIAWPLNIDPAKPNNGSLDWGSEGVPPVPPLAGQDFPSFGNYMMPPGEIFDNLLADKGTEVVQINHMDSFFGPGGLSIDTSYIPPQDFADNASKRLDPAITNLFDDSFTALEVWQGTDRSNISRFISRNLGDWFNLINQGIVRTGYAVSDSHQLFNPVVSYPRSYLASSTDDPGAVNAEQLAANTNARRVVTTNGPFIRVTSEALSTGGQGGLELGKPTLIETTDGAATITVDIQSPIWAEFDTVEFYVNTVPTIDDFDSDVTTPPEYHVAPQIVQVAGTDFAITDVDDFPSIAGARHLEATTSATLTGLTEDTWVVVLVRGTDNVSEPLFPVIPNDLSSSSNPTLADLIDGNLGESGVTAMAFSNPLFIDVNGNAGYDHRDVDSDGDGCTNAQEVGPDELDGGRRSPSNPNDYFNPSHDKLNRVDDVLDVVQAYFKDRWLDPPTNTIPNPAYNPDTDRTLIGPLAWNLGPPNGLQRVDDILNAIKQYFHDCA